MNGTTPPCEMTTSPRSLFSLKPEVRNSIHEIKMRKHVLLVIPDSKLQVPWHNTLLLVIPGSVTSQFKDLSSEIFKYSSKINWIIVICSITEDLNGFNRLTWCTSTHSLCVISLLQKTMYTTHGELKTSFRWARLCFRGGICTRGLSGLGLSANFARHVDWE